MNYVTNTEELTAIADAIREKGGTSAPLEYPEGYVSAIGDISGGGGGDVTWDAIAERTLSGVATGNASFIDQYAFYRCFSLTTASFPVCTNIDPYAFTSCRSLTTASFPACTSIGSNAFRACSSLTTASFPACININQYAFASCGSLTTASFPACTNINPYAFTSCSSLTTASFPACININQYAFASCGSLTTASFPACTNIDPYAFTSCRSLTTASFPACTSIGSNAFYLCFYLESAYFLTSSVPTLSSNVFLSTPIGGYSRSLGRYGSVFVRESLYSAFLTATNWSSIASRIVSMTDAEIEALG